MRTGLVVTGVILLLLGVVIVIGGAPVLGLGQTANDFDCGSGFTRDRECEAETAAMGAMFTSLGAAMLGGGGIIAIAGVGILVAGILKAPKTKAPPPAATSVPVQGPPMRPCPACGASATYEAKYCPACGAAISPIIPRAST